MHVPPTFPARTLHSRDGDNGGKGGLSTTTIIIIAVVCGCVGILILSLFLWRLIARCCKPRKSAPLPPVQDLAHRREQQIAAFTASRQSQWLSPPDGVMPANASYKSGSSVSLLRVAEKNLSGYMDDATTAESSVNSPVSAEDEPPLHPPNPMFYPPTGSSSSSPHVSIISTDSSYSTLPRTNTSPSPSRQPSEGHSVSQISVGSNGTRSRSRTHTPSRSNLRQPSRSRPLSQISGGTSQSGRTMRTASTSRGVPHGPFSNVQVVLPAPLAPASSQRSSSHGLPSRNSIFVDQWVGVGSRPSTTEDSGRRRNSSSASRRSQRSSSTPPTQESRSLPQGPAAPPMPKRPASAADNRRPGSSAPPTIFNNRRTPPQQSRSSSSLRNEVRKPGSHAPSASLPPARTYTGLADLAESSFEINQFMRERGRAHTGIASPQLTPSSTVQSSPRSQPTSSAPTSPQSRPRSQSRPSRPSKASDPIR